MGKELIPWALTLMSSTIALISLVHNYHKENKQEDIQTHEGLIKANYKLDELCRNMNEIRLDNKSMLNRIENIEKNQAIHEKEIRTIFNRIDELREVKKNV